MLKSARIGLVSDDVLKCQLPLCYHNESTNRVQLGECVI